MINKLIADYYAFYEVLWKPTESQYKHLNNLRTVLSWFCAQLGHAG